MTNPRLTVHISLKGVEEVEVIYKPSQRAEISQLCREYLPWLLEMACQNRSNVNPRN